jgi:hypothetical protein
MLYQCELSYTNSSYEMSVDRRVFVIIVIEVLIVAYLCQCELSYTNSSYEKSVDRRVFVITPNVIM